MKNHFIMPYSGNKREEVENLYLKIKDKIENVEYIIEPFCGSCAMSYYISLQHPNKYKYILNDNNNLLFQLLNIMKDETKYNEFIEKINNIIELITDKETYIKYTAKDTVEGWFIGNKIYNIRPFLYPQGKKINKVKSDYPIINFLRTENIQISNKDGSELYDEYKNNEKCLLLLDPPYLFTNNNFYKQPSFEIYEILNKEDLTKIKCKLCLLVNDNYVMKLIFKNCKVEEYDKQYQTTKKNIKHLLITNFI